MPDVDDRMARKPLTRTILIVAMAIAGATFYKLANQEGVTQLPEMISPNQDLSGHLFNPVFTITPEDKARSRASKNSEINRQDCIFARDYLHELETHNPAYWINGNGDRVYMSDHGRIREIERTKMQIKNYCG